MKKKMEKRIARARKKEQSDDHVADSERIGIVEMYRKMHPEENIPKDITDAYIYIIFD